MFIFDSDISRHSCKSILIYILNYIQLTLPLFPINSLKNFLYGEFNIIERCQLTVLRAKEQIRTDM